MMIEFAEDRPSTRYATVERLERYNDDLEDAISGKYFILIFDLGYCY